MWFFYSVSAYLVSLPCSALFAKCVPETKMCRGTYLQGVEMRPKGEWQSTRFCWCLGRCSRARRSRNSGESRRKLRRLPERVGVGFGQAEMAKDCVVKSYNIP